MCRANFYFDFSRYKDKAVSYLTDKHEELANSQQSGLMAWYEDLRFDSKVTCIGLLLSLGALCGAMGWRGEASSRIYFCIRTPQKVLKCADKNNRPLRMTQWHWDDWAKRGRPPQVVPDPATGVNGLVKASNPYKPFWALGAFVGFSLGGWMLRHLQDSERRLSNFQSIAEKRDVAKAELKARTELFDNYRDEAIREVELQAELEAIAGDHALVIQKAEILGEAELDITKLEADDARFEAKTAGMSDEQKQEYVNFLRQQQTPYLQGSQTLQGTIDPNDKVEGQDSGQVLAEASGEFEEYRTIGKEIIKAMAGSNKSVLIAGATGTGKTTTENYFLKSFLQRYNGAEVYAWLNKNDYGELYGLRRERLWIFDPNNIDTQPLDDVYNIYLERKDLPKPQREQLRKTRPVRLILGDWYATYQELEASLKDADLKKVLSKIRQIITVGRDSGVQLIVDTQSATLDSLGLANDASIRQSLDIFSMGFSYALR
jgi:hypothetical protein